MNEYRGSEWYKWDLHIHSKYSLEERAKLDVKAIFNSSIRLGISVISITDHSNFDGLDEIWHYWETEEIQIEGVSTKISEKIEFLPGIELKGSSGKRGIHFIAIFPKEIESKKTTKDFLTSNFLSKINCSQHDIETAGGGDYSKGLFEVSVDFEATCKKVHELGGVIIVHAGYEKDHSIEKEIAHHSSDANEDEILNSLGPLKEKYMDECIDVCELTNWSEKSLKQRDFYFNTFKKPTVVFSDAHEQIAGDKFTWIKADKSIEGFKQIIFEPKIRVTLGENRPFDPLIWLRKASLSFPISTILKDETFCYSGEHDFLFSPNYTCLIGGRGTGKSMIINLLQEKFFPKSNEFFKERIFTDSVTNDTLRIDDCIDAGNEVDQDHIEFITQNEIQKLADDYLFFTNSIYSRIIKFDSNAILKSIEIEISEHDSQLKNRIRNLFALKEKNNLLEKKRKERGMQQAIVDSFQNPEYDKLATQINELNVWLNEIKGSRSEYNQLLIGLERLIEGYSTKEIKNRYDSELVDLANRVKALLESEAKKDFSELTIQILDKEFQLNSTNTSLSDYLLKRGVSKENLNDVSAANSRIVELDLEIRNLSSEVSSIEKVINEFSFNKSIEIREKYIASLTSSAQEITKQLSAVNSPYIKTISLQYEFDLSRAINSIFDEFKERFFEPLSGLGAKEPSLFELIFAVEPCISIQRQPLLDALSQNSSTSKAKQWLIDLFTDENNFLIYQTIVLRHLFNAFNYKTIRVLYDGRRIEDSSFGQRCTATLVIFLQLGNNPIVIDEPEAHLDSLLISNYLVEVIKEKKKNRQIIFATHNANFVINGDADLIHILDMTEEKITSIRSTSIENKVNRKSLIGLEGGKEAFLSREKKYFITEIQ
jgi:energy-coupling factor transporter ATP-binding protein EcfA2